MQIAHIGRIRRNSSNGVDRTVHGLARAQASDGHKVEVWHFSNKYSEARIESEDAGILVVQLPRSKTGLLSTSNRRFLASRYSGVDLIHAHSVFIPEQIQAVVGQKYLVTPNGGYMPSVMNGRNRLLKRLWFAMFERQYLEKAFAIHAVSRSECAYLKKLLPENNVVYVPNGINESAIPRLANAAPITPANLCFLGRLAIEQKGLDILIEAFALSRLATHGVKLILAGPDFRGGLLALRRLTEHFSVSDFVLFPGELSGDSLKQFFAEPAIFVHPSRWEGMPFALIEALANGMPAIVTEGTNLSEEIVGSSAGWCSMTDVQSLANTLESAFHLPSDEFAHMRGNAQSLIRSHFLWSSIATQIDKLYKQGIQ